MKQNIHARARFQLTFRNRARAVYAQPCVAVPVLQCAGCFMWSWKKDCFGIQVGSYGYPQASIAYDKSPTEHMINVQQKRFHNHPVLRQ